MIRCNLGQLAIAAVITTVLTNAGHAQYQSRSNLPRDYTELLQRRNGFPIHNEVPPDRQLRGTRAPYSTPQPHDDLHLPVLTSHVEFDDGQLSSMTMDEPVLAAHPRRFSSRRRYPIRSRLQRRNVEYQINAGSTSPCCDGCGHCAEGFGSGDLPCCPSKMRFSRPTLQVFAGTQGTVNPRFRNVPGRAADSSFGLHQGVNWGFQIPYTDLQGQLGMRITQSNFNGASFSAENREQYFFTAGLFRRKAYGLQGGGVIDVLYDDWYVNMNLIQIRSEISWVFPSRREIGFRYTGASGGDTDLATIVNVAAGGVVQQFNETWQSVNTFRFFLRSSLGRSGEGQVVLGFSDEGDTILASDASFQFSPRFGVRGGFDYLIPANSNFPVNSLAQAWNVSISLVWYPGGSCSTFKRPSRPLFDIADNGSFFITRVAPLSP